MRNILVITDCEGKGEIDKVQNSLEVEKHRVVISASKDVPVQLVHRWNVIIVWVDSIRVAQETMRLIRETGRNKDTPIIFRQPNPLMVRNVSIAYEATNFPSIVHNVLSAKEQVKKKKLDPA